MIPSAQYIFDELGFDCLWTATLLQPDRTAFFNFMQVSQTYGYTVVGLGPQIPLVPIWRSIFNWTQPFAGSVWLVLFSSFAFASVIFVLLETDKLGGMFQSETQHWLFSLWSSFHLAIRAWTQTGYFEPVRKGDRFLTENKKTDAAHREDACSTTASLKHASRSAVHSVSLPPQVTAAGIGFSMSFSFSMLLAAAACAHPPQLSLRAATALTRLSPGGVK